MNLFAEESKKLLREQGFKEDWIEVLSNEVDAEKFKNILDKVSKDRKTKTVYPAKEDVFKLFRTVSYKDVKVVIIGQDPYHNGNANGIAFACKVDVSPSLLKIGEAIRTNGYTHNPLRTRLLEHLTNQGVFPYNTILTVRQGEPLSHKDIGWDHFTACVIAALNEKENVAWLLWGAEAQSYGRFINTNHLILQCEHPAAASYGKRAWNCTHFTDVNRWLEGKGLTKINW